MRGRTARLISEEDRRMVRTMFLYKFSYAQICEKFGLSYDEARMVVNKTKKYATQSKF